MKIGKVFKLMTFFATTIALMCIMCITGSAASVNATEVELYSLPDWSKEFISIPEGSDSFQIKVSDGTDVYYYVAKGDSVTVSDTGLIKTATRTIYWNGNVGYSYPTGAEGEYAETRPVFGESVVRVVSGDEYFDISVNVLNYNEVYADKIMDDYIDKNITSDMSGYEKLDEICRFVASYNYSGNYSSAYSMIVSGGGDCWASTSAVLIMCEKVGIDAWMRNAANDPGAGSGHRNVIAYCDGKYYLADAGFVGTAPRYYDLYEKTSLFSTRISDYDNKKIEIYQYDGKSDVTSLEIPSEIGGYKVTSIAASAFSYLYDLKTVKLPDTLEEIGSHAFSCNSSSLEALEIPKNVQIIGDNPFENCKLLNLTVSKDNPYFVMSDGVLYTADKKELVCATKIAEKFVVPDTVELIRRYSFRLNSNITYVFIPSSVTEIGEGAFGECSSLVSVSIDGSKLEIIDDFAFYRSGSLKDIILPDSVKSIGLGAFGYCSDLEVITIPDSVTTIEESVFIGDGKLVIACGVGSCAEQYAIDNDIDYVRPIAKSTLKAAKGNNQVYLSWTAVDGADYYQIIRRNKGIDTVVANIGGTSATVKGLTNGFTYTYLIKAVASDGRTSLSDKVSIAPVAVLEKSVLKATVGDKQVTLNWTKVEGASYYQIIRYNKGNYSLVANISGTSAVVKGLANKFEYTYLIKAVATDGRTSLSAAVNVTPMPPLEKPVLTAVSQDKQVTLSWTKVEGAGYYQIIRYNKGTYTLIANISGTTATVKGLTNNFEYTYLIKAVASDGRTALSTAVNVTPRAPLAKPVLAAAGGDRQALLLWMEVAEADYYEIIRYKNGVYSKVAAISGTCATVKGLTNNFEYTYLVRAVAKDGRSSVSNAVYVTPKA